MPNPDKSRNFLIHSMEGGLYMGGLAFLSAESVLPAMVHSLGGSDFLVALMPSLLVIGFFTPVLFVVPLLNRLHRYKPTVIIGGLAQRLPYLIAALALYFFADDYPAIMLATVVLAPLVSGLVGGLTINAWLEMVTRMIPQRVRASGWAIRFIIQGVIGIAAGPLIRQILAAYPGPPGYAHLHLIAFLFLFASLLLIFFMKETDLPNPEIHRHRRYVDQLLDIPRKARAVPQYFSFLVARFTGVGFIMLTPFMAIHALAVSGHPEEDVGLFVTTQAFGWIFGNTIAAAIGNRRGGKVVLLISRLLLISIALFVAVNTSFNGFLAAFFAFGFAFGMDRVGDLTLSVEMCPKDDRPALLALQTFILMPAFLLGAAAVGLIEHRSGQFSHAALAVIAITLVSLGVLTRIRDPRHRGPEEQVA